MTRRELLDALTAERYGRLTPEHHNTYAPDPPQALRLIHDQGRAGQREEERLDDVG